MTQAPGVTVKVAWVSPTGASGNNSNKFRVVGEFLLMCYIGNGGGPSNSCEDTSARPEGPWTPGISSYAYPQATLIGIALGVTSTALGPNTVYGNTVNAYQRIILVK